MTRPLTSSALRLMSLLFAFMLGIGAITAFEHIGLLSPFKTSSESHDSQVIRAVTRTQEVSLLRLAIQGIDEKHQHATVFGKSIPGTGEKAFVEYKFNAKLGLDGARVKITKTGNNAYLISVPEFKFIGYDKPSFQVAAEDGGVLSWVTPDIDQLEMVNEVLGPQPRQKYLASYQGELQQQTKAFYNRLITRIDPAVHTRFEFAS